MRCPRPEAAFRDFVIVTTVTQGEVLLVVIEEGLSVIILVDSVVFARAVIG
jgi:hypothetical protein